MMHSSLQHLRNEIDRRLKRVSEIKVEPKVMSPLYEDAFQNGRTQGKFDIIITSKN
jgi:hypothetical protein